MLFYWLRASNGPTAMFQRYNSNNLKAGNVPTAYELVSLDPSWPFGLSVTETIDYNLRLKQ